MKKTYVQNDGDGNKIITEVDDDGTTNTTVVPDDTPLNTGSGRIHGRGFNTGRN